jgi:hypothetical protein
MSLLPILQETQVGSASMGCSFQTAPDNVTECSTINQNPFSTFLGFGRRRGIDDASIEFAEAGGIRR